MLKSWFKLIRAALIVIGVLLSFFAFVEIVRAYQTLYDMHPAAGYTFLTVILVGVVWLLLYIVFSLASRPRALTAPVIDDYSTASKRQLQRYIKYLLKYLARLVNNELITDEDSELILTGIAELNAVLETSDSEVLVDAIGKVESTVIEPVLSTIDEHAKKQIRTSMRDVMLGVTLSPYKSADLIIVVYRNFVMVGRIIRIYNTRPTVGQQWRIFSDILSVVATVNYINMGRNLIEALASRVPGIGHFTDDIAQGIGAGFMTTVAGHAALDRCRAFKGWDRAEAKDSILKKVGDFYADVKDLFFSDIFSLIKTRTGDASSELKDKVASALDDTGNVLGKCITMPIKAGAAGTKAVVNTSVKGVSWIGRGLTFPFRRKK